MLTYLFPGQGSQSLGMGKELFPLFKGHLEQAEAILGYSITSLCLEDLKQQLGQTQFTQPALFIVNALSYLKILEDTGKKPDYAAGHSLGEYNALFAAEVFDFATGLQLVKKRAELMSEVTDGGMAAVIGLPSDEIIHVLNQNHLSVVNIANYNSYQQTVLSGPVEALNEVKALFAKIARVSFIPLKVSGAFHSSYMLKAQQSFAHFLHDFDFAPPVFPVIANLNAMPYHPWVIKANLIQQISQPVEWLKTMNYLQSKSSYMTFREIGPGSVLSGLLSRINRHE